MHFGEEDTGSALTDKEHISMYERTTTSQHIAVSNVLSGAGDSSTSAQKLNIPTPRFSVFPVFLLILLCLPVFLTVSLM